MNLIQVLKNTFWASVLAERIHCWMVSTMPILLFICLVRNLWIYIRLAYTPPLPQSVSLHLNLCQLVLCNSQHLHENFQLAKPLASLLGFLRSCFQ